MDEFSGLKELSKCRHFVSNYLSKVHSVCLLSQVLRLPPKAFGGQTRLPPDLAAAVDQVLEPAGSLLKVLRALFAATAEGNVDKAEALLALYNGHSRALMACSYNPDSTPAASLTKDTTQGSKTQDAAPALLSNHCSLEVHEETVLHMASRLGRVELASLFLRYNLSVCPQLLSALHYCLPSTTVFPQQSTLPAPPPTQLTASTNGAVVVLLCSLSLSLPLCLPSDTALTLC